MSDSVGSAQRIAMWSGPRNLSTAMMRSWENRADTTVMDEPLYAAYLAESGSDHPSAAEIIAAGPATYEEAIAACFAPLPDETSISYQKHMAHHLIVESDLSWLDGLTNCLLLRDPRWVLASYLKVRDSVSLEEIGLPQQLVLADRCELIFDSADFLADPEAGLRTICEAVGAAFDPAMLTWPAGKRSSDGVWAKHWYASVEASTGFGPPPGLTAPPELSGELQVLGAEAMEIYQALKARSITV